MQGLLNQVSETAYAAGVSMDDLLFVVRRQYLITVLKANDLNQCRTARALGMHRNTVSRNMADLKIRLAPLRDELLVKKAAASVKPSAAAVSNAG